MRRAAVGAVLALALVGCTKAGPPPPDFYATLEAIRVELTAAAPAPPLWATATPSPTETAAPPTPLPPPTGTPVPEETVAAPTAEAPPVATAALPTPTPVQYTVQRGDYLSAIAAQYGVTLEALIAANGITNPNVIEVGQVLVIPTAATAP